MRYGLLFLAAIAYAQQPDPRGFVNERLLRRNVFAKSAVPMNTAPRVLLDAPLPKCAIPLLEVKVDKDIDKSMVMPHFGVSMDPKMILPTIPVCPAK
jgi:hypothetical protein